MLVKVPLVTADESSGGLSQLPLLAPCVSPSMRAIESIIAGIESTGLPVLVTGETGTGKEVVALRIHELSKRSHDPFVKLRCSGLRPDDFSRLLENSGEAVGLSGSTVFLDEISDLSSPSQARLLEGFVGLNGGPEKFQLGACIISSTCQNLEAAMQNGNFRDDLYYRLSGICLRLPPLRERKEDILPLTDFFLDKYARAFRRPRPQVSAATIERIQGHSWPGNIRELENTVKRLVALGDECLAVRSMGEDGQALPLPAMGGGSYSLKQAARAASRVAEKELIMNALSRTRWNRKRAAEELRISYKALLYKLKQIGVEEPNV
ncbi:MAG: sigma 54-interacting transcriptional regulator [Terriglobia bacterium]